MGISDKKFRFRVNSIRQKIRYSPKKDRKALNAEDFP